MKKTVLFILLSSLLFLPLETWSQPKKSMGSPMYYQVVGGDTVYVDVLQESRVWGRNRKMKSSDWKKYYKLVYNFNKVYPYALVGRKMMAQVDSTIAADVEKKSQKNAYINDVEKELFRLFEKDIRNMTISQGAVLMKLVDRECGLSSYEIIQTYESNFAAGFWQVVAKLFSHDLKKHYDPKGDDWQMEDLVYIWDSGQWDSFYFSIFGKYPTKTVISKEELSSSVKK